MSALKFIGIDMGVADRASEDDRLWFEAHPREQVRVRAYVPGEVPTQWPPPRYTIVRRVFPGCRVRVATDSLAFTAPCWDQLADVVERVTSKERPHGA